MSDHEPTKPGQEDTALPPDLALLDRALLAAGRRWRRMEPSTTGLERHVRALVQAGGPRLRSEDAMFTERTVPDHIPDPHSTRDRRPESRWRGPLALVATFLLIALAATVFAFLRTGAPGTGSGQQGRHATPTPGLTRVTAIQPGDPALHLPANGYLSSLSFSSAHDGWAVGGIRAPETASAQPVATKAVMVHYHDGVWSAGADSFPNLALDSVSMVSATDGWAVGQIDIQANAKAPADYYTGAVLLHYTGGHWKNVTKNSSAPGLATFYPQTIHMFSPDAGYIIGEINVPSSVAQGSVDERVAFGIYENGSWILNKTVFPFPDSQMAMVSTSEGWASAVNAASSAGQSPTTTIYHYLNGVWTPSVTFPGVVTSLSAASRVDVFALATQCHHCSEPSPRIEHYNGTGWAQMNPPNQSATNNLLGFQHSMLMSQTIYDGAASGVWISYVTMDTNSTSHPLYMTATWREKTSGDGWQLANPSSIGGEILAFSADGNGGMWAITQDENPLTMNILYTQGMKWTLYGRS